MLIQLKEFHCDTDSLEKGGLMRVFFMIVMNNCRVK